jgi:hypothetical protein
VPATGGKGKGGKGTASPVGDGVAVAALESSESRLKPAFIKPSFTSTLASLALTSGAVANASMLEVFILAELLRK